MIARDSLSEEFFDRTSAQLLAQPEPQYLYAGLFMAALGISLNVPALLGRPSVEIGGQGAAYTAAEAHRLRLSDALSTELFSAKADFKGEPGHTIKFNRPKFANSTYTQAAREIGTNQTVSTTPMNAGSEQALLTIKRFAGPYGASAVQPYGLDEFDASMGVHDLSQFVGTHLSRDFQKTLESFWVTLADNGSSTLYPAGMTADNDATAAGMFGLTYETLSRAAKTQNEANLPTFADGKRVLVATPTGKKQLMDDPQFARYAEFHADKNPFTNPNWFASTPDYHCFLSNTLTQANNSSSVSLHTAHAIAPGAFLGGTGIAPRVAASSDDNYGLSAKVIWVAHLALALADNRFITKLKYTADA